MEYNNSISRMTLGTVQLGLNYGIANIEGKPDEEKAFMILNSAFGSGVNCLDTAADYGDSEKVIGKYLSERKKIRSEVCLVTKFKLGRIDGSDVETTMMRSIEKSLKNLRTDYLDILLMHDANEYATFGNKMTEVFEKLLTEGIIKMAGASCYKFSEIEVMMGNEIYHAFQIPVNLLDMRITRGKGAVRLKEKLVFARSVFLQGLFFLDPANLTGNLKEIDKYLIKIAEIAGEMNITVAQLSAAYVNSLSYIDSLVIGGDNPEQVRENARLLDFRPFGEKTLNSIEEKLKGSPDWLLMPPLWDKQN
jgi:aryl-alcohol dehydrogenase-like predicted oxidoreductase